MGQGWPERRAGREGRQADRRRAVGRTNGRTIGELSVKLTVGPGRANAIERATSTRNTTSAMVIDDDYGMAAG